MLGYHLLQGLGPLYDGYSFGGWNGWVWVGILMAVPSWLWWLLQNKPAVWINANHRLPSRLIVSRAVVIADSETSQQHNYRRRN
jgi:hypothetical protein